MMSASSTNDIVETIKNTLLEHLVEFTNIRDVCECKVKPMNEFASNEGFASVMYVAEVIDNSTDQTTSLVVKVMPDNPHMRKIQSSDEQFYNEDLIFQRVIPLMIKCSNLSDTDKVTSLFPKCYYASHDPKNLMIVLENLKVGGYVLADMTVDYEHCKLALEGLARYHALSYAMKHNHKDVFQREVVEQVKEAMFSSYNRRQFNILFLKYMSMEPVHFIRNDENPENVAFRTKHEAFLNNLERALEQPVALMERSNIPREPLAVLCHGDFNRNNMMFRYDSQGTPSRVKFVDFQAVRYGNPSTDIAFFLFFNTSHELRKTRIADLWASYQKTIVDCLVEMTDCTREYLESVYSVKAFKEDFERCAVCAYIISAFFIHFMLATEDEVRDMEKWMENEEGQEVPSEEYLKDVVRVGGDVALARSVAIIKEMAQMNCL